MDDQIIHNETEVECYGISLEQFKTEIRLMTKIILKNYVDSIKNKLIEKLKNINSSSETLKTLSDYSIDNLCLKIFNEFDPEFEEFDKLIDKTFSLPENVVYHFDENLSKFTNSDEAFLENEILEQETWFKQNKYMILVMETELEAFKKIGILIEKEKQMIKILEKSLENFNNDFVVNENLMETVDNISHFEQTKI